jgi:hypothetical protein
MERLTKDKSFKKKSNKKEEYWLIPPSRCKYAQQFEREVGIDGHKGTKFECICCINYNQESLYFYKCCEKNCPKMNELEKMMFKKR